MQCPEGPDADADGFQLDNLTDQQLWAAEHARVNSRIASANRNRNRSGSMAIDLVTRDWLRTAVSQLLGLREMANEEIEAEADTLLQLSHR
ncbi:hypothetical protein VNI00_017558 [Paramarasmius palmivorus]|uniref:Uncharacterized protein n=1 Tax=Paramarasmius palmivorus TaxID=297713 RepID=A0AAW0B4Z6_9AGAR